MNKGQRKVRRKKSIRKKVFGTKERPRMCVSRSLRNLSVQIIDDVEGLTLCSATTLSRATRDRFKSEVKSNVESAAILGEEIAKAAAPKGIKKVVFDRSGYRYHGVIKTLADSARKNGLEF